MLQFGIDIVDFRETGGHHPRFQDRALSDREKASAAGFGENAIWSFWAAKEAAFKAHAQGIKLPFHPREWEVDLEAGFVLHQSHRFALKIHSEKNHVRAACAKATNFQLYEALHEYPEACVPAKQSADARALLKELCVARFGPGVRLELKGIPWLDHKGAAVSISHHGRWTYAALALGPEA